MANAASAKTSSARTAAIIVFCAIMVAAHSRPRATGVANAEARCPAFDELLARVNAAPDARAKSKAVDDVVACVPGSGAPLMEKGTKDGFGRAIFLYRGPATLVALAGDMNGWTPSEAFTPVSGTNLFFLSREYESDARVDYKFVLNDKEWIFDPMNPRRIEGGVGREFHFCYARVRAAARVGAGAEFASWHDREFLVCQPDFEQHAAGENLFAVGIPRYA